MVNLSLCLCSRVSLTPIGGCIVKALAIKPSQVTGDLLVVPWTHPKVYLKGDLSKVLDNLN